MRVLYIYSVGRKRRMYLHDPGLTQFKDWTVACINGTMAPNRVRALQDLPPKHFYDVTILHGYMAFKPIYHVRRRMKKALGLLVFCPSNDIPWFRARNQDAVQRLKPEIILPEQYVRLGWYAKAAKLHAEWFPPACCTDVFFPINGFKQEYDIAFAGTMARASKYGKRNKWVRELKDIGFKTLIRSGVTQQEFNKIYNSAPIGFHMSQFFSEDKPSQGTAYRVFEVGGIGSCLVMDRNAHVDRLFKAGKHYLSYGGNSPWQQLVDRVAWAVENPSEAAKIGKAMQREILEKHTYIARGQRFREIIGRYV